MNVSLINLSFRQGSIIVSVASPSEIDIENLRNEAGLNGVTLEINGVIYFGQVFPIVPESPMTTAQSTSFATAASEATAEISTTVPVSTTLSQTPETVSTTANTLDPRGSSDQTDTSNDRESNIIMIVIVLCVLVALVLVVVVVKMNQKNSPNTVEPSNTVEMYVNSSLCSCNLFLPISYYTFSFS